MFLKIPLGLSAIPLKLHFGSVTLSGNPRRLACLPTGDEFGNTCAIWGSKCNLRRAISPVGQPGVPPH